MFTDLLFLIQILPILTIQKPVKTNYMSSVKLKIKLFSSFIMKVKNFNFNMEVIRVINYNYNVYIVCCVNERTSAEATDIESRRAKGWPCILSGKRNCMSSLIGT